MVSSTGITIMMAGTSGSAALDSSIGMAMFVMASPSAVTGASGAGIVPSGLVFVVAAGDATGGWCGGTATVIP